MKKLAIVRYQIFSCIEQLHLLILAEYLLKLHLEWRMITEIGAKRARLLPCFNAAFSDIADA